MYEEEEIDIQFDISFFLNFHIPYRLSSYRATEFDNRIPQMAINVLSKSTWKSDLSENLECVRAMKIPIYLVFAPFHVASRFYAPPFVRVYLLQQDGTYIEKDLHQVSNISNGKIESNSIIDLEGRVPFHIGLVRLDKMHEKDKELYRLVLVDPKQLTIYPTKTEKAELLAYEEKQRADAEKQKSDKYFELLKKHGIIPD
jgi:hypothetical protein